MKRKLMATILAASMIAVMGTGVYADSAVESAASGAESAEEAIDTTNHTGKHFKFGYTCMDGTNPFFVTIQNEMKEKIEANGDTLVITDPGNDSSKQISQVEDMLSQNLDGLFVNPVDATFRWSASTRRWRICPIWSPTPAPITTTQARS